MRKGLVPDDEIDLPFDGFPSLRDRDIAMNKARRERDSKHFRATDKLRRALQTEQGNIDNLKEVAEKRKEIYVKRVLELLSDIKGLTAIIMKHPEVIGAEDLKFITDLSEKMVEAQNEEEL